MCVPEIVSPSEKIIRGIFTPLYYDEKKNKIKSIAFRAPHGKDEVSVLRLNYTNATFCKKHCKEKLQNPNNQKNYYGLAVFYASKVFGIGADFKYTPLDGLPMHVDIAYGYISVQGEPFPVELRIMIDKLIDSVSFYKDENLNSELWEGAELNCVE